MEGVGDAWRLGKPCDLSDDGVGGMDDVAVGMCRRVGVVSSAAAKHRDVADRVVDG